MGFGAAQGPGINPLKQVELSSDPAAVANTGLAYWKDTGSGNEFYLEDESGNVIQVTDNGSIAGGGGGISSIRTEAVDYTATTSDDVILCNAAALTITLFAASGNSGEVLYIKNIHATGVVTISGDSAGETLDGDVSKFITTQYATLTLLCDGSDWHIL